MMLCPLNSHSLLLAVGEPPLVMSSSALFAAKRAIESARAEAGNNELFTLCEYLLVSTTCNLILSSMQLLLLLLR